MKGWTMLSSLALLGLVAGGAVAANDEQAAKVLFETKCSVCHDINRPLGKKKDRAGWERTVKRMQGKRADLISDAEVEIIVNYLAEVRGP
jgi:cytochrome c5